MTPVVLYTDGLVEHGRCGIDEGIARLTGVLAEVGELPLEKLCDELLNRIVPERADDDIAILAVRCHPEVSRPRAVAPLPPPTAAAAQARGWCGPDVSGQSR